MKGRYVGRQGQHDGLTKIPGFTVGLAYAITAARML